MSFWQDTEDWHTAGEPFRIVRHLPPGCLQDNFTVAEQRLHVLKSPGHPLELLRQSLCYEPRGHADMYGGFITPPNDSGAHFGVMFFHRDGFSTACGHGTIALGYWAIANGIVVAPRNGTVEVIIDAPSGRVKARATCNEGRVAHVDFVNVPSYKVRDDIKVVPVDLPSGPISMNLELVYAGALMALVDVEQLDLTVDPENHRSFVEIQHQIKESLSEVRYQCDGVYGVCFFQREAQDAAGIAQRNVFVFADGQIDRSPCGSATSACLVSLYAQQKIALDQVFTNKSIIGTAFEGRVVGETVSLEMYPAFLTEVRGTARLVAKTKFYIDPSDPIYPGFLFR